MSKETEKKQSSWLKNVFSNTDQADREKTSGSVVSEDVYPVKVSPDSTEGEGETSHQTEEPENRQDVFSKENQDKVAVDMINALENMLKDREINLYKINALEDQLKSANETIARQKDEGLKKDQLLSDRHEEIQALESNLTNKQMSYDQLLEDYKEFQNKSNEEYEQISNQLEKEISKYEKLNEDATQAQYQSMLQVKELEEKIRNLEIENQNYKEQNERVMREKAELMQTINDFTERMSFSFSPKQEDKE